MSTTLKPGSLGGATTINPGIIFGPIETATAAIAAKHSSLGGDTGILGPAVTDTIGDIGAAGYHVDYQKGSIYYSPATGAHAIFGDIRNKWIGQGGPKSGIGYPITDEASTPDNACRFNTFQNGAGIYWTATTGAHLIYGEIYKKWMSMGGEASILKYPITDEASTADNVCRFNNFSGGGAIYWTAALGGFAIYGDIYNKWISMGGESSFLKYPVTDETSTADNACRYNNFSGGGAIYWTAALGSFAIYGNIYQKWMTMGGETSILKYPITDETSTPDNVCRFNNFSGGGAIYWTAALGSFAIYGDIYKTWMSLGGEQSPLGYPITDETASGTLHGRYNDFKNGMIYWSPNTGTHVHQGPLPDQLPPFNPQHQFPSGIAVGGYSVVTLHSTGDVEYRGDMHDSGFPDYDYTVAVVIVDADTRGYSFTHSGKTFGTLSTGSRDSVWDIKSNNPVVAANWRALVASAVMRSNQDNRENSELLSDLSAGLDAVSNLEGEGPEDGVEIGGPEEPGTGGPDDPGTGGPDETGTEGPDETGSGGPDEEGGD